MLGAGSDGTPGASPLAAALTEAGGIAAPRDRSAQLRALLADELAHGERELRAARSGYSQPVVVGFASTRGRLVAALPVSEALRADPGAASEREWLLAAAAVGALTEAAAGGELLAGALAGRLLLVRGDGEGEGHEAAEMAALAFEEQARPIDRLRALGLALPAHVLGDPGELRPPFGAAHPLRVARRWPSWASGRRARPTRRSTRRRCSRC